MSRVFCQPCWCTGSNLGSNVKIVICAMLVAHVGSQQETSTEGTSQHYCYCDGPDEGRMVGDNDPTCKYRWFHLETECLGLKSEPKTKQLVLSRL